MDFFLDPKSALIEHLRDHALRTDGPFTLASGATSDWYLDGRQTTFDGEGARRVAACVLEVLRDDVTALARFVAHWRSQAQSEREPGGD